MTDGLSPLSGRGQIALAKIRRLLFSRRLFFLLVTGSQLPCAAFLVAQFLWPNLYKNFSGVRISSSNRELFTKQRVSIRVSGRYSNNAEKFLSDGFELQLSDHAVASVNADGELVALRPGKIEIVARAGGLRSTPLTLLVKESQKTTQPQTKPGKTYESNSVNPTTVTEQTKARIAAYINRAESLREQGNYAAALAELERAKAIDNFSEEIRKEIEQTRRACNAERALGSKVDC